MRNALNETGIRDLAVYLQRMQKSVLDKMFFIDKVFEPFDSIVDFGCANGELIKALGILFGEYEYVGYDISDEMIEAARANVPEARFTTGWEDLGVKFERSLINISSTIHEVYSYCADEEIEEFWDRVFNSGFKYISIRDMMLSEKDRCAADQEHLEAVRENGKYRDHFRDYESVWGKIETRRDLVHYLLKYSYYQNWEREVRENYIGLELEAFLKLIPDSYELTYFYHFTLPYTAWQIKRDFGIELKTPTHVKAILKRRT